MRLTLLIVTVGTIRLALALVRLALRRPRLGGVAHSASRSTIALARSLQGYANRNA
ncbi:MAG: hypothetical protein WAP03_12795 [Methylorubrum rhodinum]|uniref:hypothetical protein n=1 Tax=Methylorubrum rhodinum TaxID=29428 RepID=UPI003BAE5F45